MVYFKDIMEGLCRTYAGIITEWETQNVARKDTINMLKDLRLSLKKIMNFYSENHGVRKILSKARKRARLAKQSLSNTSVQPLKESPAPPILDPRHLENLCVDFQVSSPRPDLALSILGEQDYQFLPQSISYELDQESLIAKTKAVLLTLLEYYVSVSVIKDAVEWDIDRELCTLSISSACCKSIYTIVLVKDDDKSHTRRQEQFVEGFAAYLDDADQALDLPFDLGNLSDYVNMFCLLLLDVQYYEYQPNQNLNVRFCPIPEPCPPNPAVSESSGDLEATTSFKFVERINRLTVQIFNNYEQIHASDKYTFLQRKSEICLADLFDIYNQNYLLLSQVLNHLIVLEQFVYLLSSKQANESLAQVSNGVEIKLEKNPKYKYIWTCSVFVPFENPQSIRSDIQNHVRFEFDYLDLKTLYLDVSGAIDQACGRTFTSEICAVLGVKDVSDCFKSFTESLLDWFDRRRGHLYVTRVRFQKYMYFRLRRSEQARDQFYLTQFPLSKSRGNSSRPSAIQQFRQNADIVLGLFDHGRLQSETQLVVDGRRELADQSAGQKHAPVPPAGSAAIEGLLLFRGFRGGGRSKWLGGQARGRGLFGEYACRIDIEQVEFEIRQVRQELGPRANH